MDWQNKNPPANTTDTSKGGTAADVAADNLPMRPRALVITHWLTALLLALAVAVILIRDQVDGRAWRLWLLEGHRHLGLLILLLFFIRAGLRYRLGKWPPAGDTSALVRFAAGSTHFALYALLLVQPLLGWTLSSAEGKPVHFFGLTLPALVGSDEDLADRLTEWHEGVAWLLLALIALHVGAALWHHFILRDRTLRMMLARRRR
ncbi:cytochrome b [Dyella telluris]|uniref:Cytochrome b/b6 domain-containing protein n=1 Tax=Dyella telluris TaxID=2763498 RepID=A0A7G8Q3C6_9GAMM|nr:cytochrome b/b6 domain-containing protein [Dyella telluris]QNK01284.1 cytochrome b/b6 domain-containing protein [Dyella telluris]